MIRLNKNAVKEFKNAALLLAVMMDASGEFDR